jgi:hypothetical protein
VNFKYERLPRFCFLCGLIQHGERGCEKRHGPKNLEVAPYFGPWLHVPSPTRRRVVTQEPATPLYEHVESGFARTPRGTQAYTAANNSSSHRRPSPKPKGRQVDPSVTAMETQEESPKSPIFPGVEDSATVTGRGNLGDTFRGREEKITNVIPEGNKKEDMGVKKGQYIPQIEPDSTRSNNKGKGMEHNVAKRVTKRENKAIKDGLTIRNSTIVNGPKGFKGPSTAPGSIFPPLATRGSQAVGGFTTTPKQTWKRKA